MKKTLALIGKQIGIILVGAIIGLVALLLVFQIPVERIEHHIYQSLPMIEGEFQSELVIPGYAASNRGSFTDCLMLEHAIYEAEERSTLEQVLYMYRGESGQGDGWAPGYSLVDYLSGVEQTRIEQYPRYWHGYLVVLKPMLYFMTVNAMRILASTIQFALVGIIMMLCGQKKEQLLGASVLLSIPFLYFFSLYSSLSLSICFYIMAIMMIIQLKWHEKLLIKHRYQYFFLIGGMVTAYFDFLTYPLVTLGFPLCVALYLNKTTWKDNLKKLILFSIEWGVGYVGLWGMKWLLTDILTGGNTIQDAFATVALRSDNVEGHSKLSGYIKVLGLNIEPFGNWAFYIIIFSIIIGLVLLVLTKREQIKIRENWLNALVIFFIALMPFVWFFFTQNHSSEHSFFTCKILSISVFAFICSIGKLVQK